MNVKFTLLKCKVYTITYTIKGGINEVEKLTTTDIKLIIILILGLLIVLLGLHKLDEKTIETCVNNGNDYITCYELIHGND